VHLQGSLSSEETKKWEARLWEGIIAAGNALGHAALFTETRMTAFEDLRKYALGIQPQSMTCLACLQPLVVGYVRKGEDWNVYLMHPSQDVFDSPGASQMFVAWKAALLEHLQDPTEFEWLSDGQFTRSMLAAPLFLAATEAPEALQEKADSIASWLRLPEVASLDHRYDRREVLPSKLTSLQGNPPSLQAQNVIDQDVHEPPQNVIDRDVQSTDGKEKLWKVVKVDGGVIQAFTGGLNPSDKIKVAELLGIDLKEDLWYFDAGQHRTNGAIARDDGGDIVGVQLLSEEEDFITLHIEEGRSISVAGAQGPRFQASSPRALLEERKKWSTPLVKGIIAAGKELGHAALFTKTYLSFSLLKKYLRDDEAAQTTNSLKPLVVGYVYDGKEYLVVLMHSLQDGSDSPSPAYKTALLKHLKKQEPKGSLTGQWLNDGQFTCAMLFDNLESNSAGLIKIKRERLHDVARWLGLPE